MAAPKKSSKKTTPQVMDVSKPGKTPPPSTSKPIIVTHGPRVGDPMVSDKSGDSSDKSENEPFKIQVSRTSPKVIKPLSEIDKKVDNPPPEADEKTDEKLPEQDLAKPSTLPVNEISDNKKSAPVIAPKSVNLDDDSDDKKEEPAPEEQPDKEPSDDKEADKEDVPVPEEEDKPEENQPEPEAPAKEKETEPETKDSVTEEVPEEDESDMPAESNDLAEQAAEQTATVNAVAAQTRDRGAENKQAEEDRKRQEHIAQIIEEKKYFLPIQPSRKHRQKKLTLIILLIVLLALGGLMAAKGWLDLSGIGLPGGLSSEEQIEEPAPAPVAPVETEEPDDEKAAADAVAEAKNTERKTDIDTIATNLDGYFAQFGNYPTLDQLNDKAFREENLKSLKDDALADPDGAAPILADGPVENSYSYETLPDDCDNDQLVCAGYTLTATLSDGSTYQKQSQEQN